MSTTRIALLVGSIVGLACSSLMLFLTGELKSNAVFIIALLASVAAFGALALLTVMVLAKTKRELSGKTLRTIKVPQGAWILGFLFALAMTIIAPLFAMDWGVGAGIRAWALWSFLPEGNLLWAGRASGVIAVLFFSLFAALAAGGLWNAFQALPDKVKQSFASVPKRQSLMPSVHERSYEPEVQADYRPSEAVNIMPVDPSDAFMDQWRTADAN